MGQGLCGGNTHVSNPAPPAAAAAAANDPEVDEDV